MSVRAFAFSLTAWMCAAGLACARVEAQPAGQTTTTGTSPAKTGTAVDAQHSPLSQRESEELRHATPEWQTMQGHLPDLKTVPAERLELTGDVLRARKFPEDALVYYLAAVQRGGDKQRLLNKLGVTELDLDQYALASKYFQRLVKINKKSADGWNNLAAVEYVQGNFGGAIQDYKKAVKLSNGSATFHANLANAYMQDKNYGNARKEFAAAIEIDPHVFEPSLTIGTRIQLPVSEDRGRYCYEMARLYAQQGNEANVLHWLAKSSETGFDIETELRWDSTMSRYRKDPRVLTIESNSRLLASGKPVSAMPIEQQP